MVGKGGSHLFFDKFVNLRLNIGLDYQYDFSIEYIYRQ